MEKRNGFHKELVDFNGEANTYTLTKTIRERRLRVHGDQEAPEAGGSLAPHHPRAAIASYELEMNIVIHSNGGELIAEYSKDKLVITARDTGPESRTSRRR
jgi:anti-sigma regulatory factor (Ser/Thr protein kinase)